MLPFYKAEAIRLYGKSAKRVRLMEDGAKAHSGPAARAWKAANWPGKLLASKGDGCYFWPGNSPDLNPIENVWHALKKHLNQFRVPADIGALRELLNEEIPKFEQQNQQLFAHLYDSMPTRIDEVIEANGAPIRY